MATQSYTGEFIGKLGNVVGYRGYDGKNLVRVHNPTPKNPNTPKQQANRALFGKATHLVPYLDPILCEANMANGYPTTRHGVKVSMLTRYLKNLPDDQHCPLELPIVKEPGVDLHFKELSLTLTGRTLTLHAVIDPRLAKRILRTISLILFYNTKNNEYRSERILSVDLSDFTCKIPCGWEPEDVQLNGYILIAFKKKGVSELGKHLEPSTTHLTDLQYVEWSQLHSIPLSLPHT